PFSWGTQKREAAAPKASGCFMGGTCAVREEPEKQKPRSCRAQELARSSAQENARQKKLTYRDQRESVDAAEARKQSQAQNLGKVLVFVGTKILGNLVTRCVTISVTQTPTSAVEIRRSVPG